MKNLQNLHTHSKYCDGRDTPEEMIAFALSKGFDSIGFSGHSYMHFSPSYSMSIEGTEEYKREIISLKKKYAGQIDIFLGLEFEMYSETELSDYEYLIGSLHYFRIGDEYVGFDRKADEVLRVINEHFGATSSNFTSPVSLKPDFLLASGTRVVPTSIITAPSFTISAFTKFGWPRAAMMMSASWHSFTKSLLRLWHTVTVASPG